MGLSRPDWAEDDSEVLPPGFGTRTMGCGVVNLGWAPQLDILAHHAIGGCMFHAGWSTLIETVHFGHGLVFLPFSAVQKLDARMAVGKGIGLKWRGTEMGCSTVMPLLDPLGGPWSEKKENVYGSDRGN